SIEVGQLLGVAGAGILRVQEDGEVVVLGSWAVEPERQFKLGTRFPVAPGSELARALEEGQALRVDTHAQDTDLGAIGYQASLIAPLAVGGRTWGFLAAVAREAGALGNQHERRLSEFADLIAAAVNNIEDRAALARQAATDSLTGLANRRALQQRLGANLARARRQGSPVSVAVVDVDRFKLINDGSGHATGDEILVAVARGLASAARAQDTVARVGGDEFAWILPDTAGEAAIVAVERARQAISGSGAGAGATISAGVCDSVWAADPEELLRLADRALYAAKSQGRDRVHLYVPARVDELAPR
ncbi:MAG: sensor domain-containing diguanylate cyclase, partial [Solirubrobacteraceae bacterium]